VRHAGGECAAVFPHGGRPRPSRVTSVV
jgi:hypothetical protein